MSGLFRLSRSLPRDPRIDAWFAGPVRLDREADALFPEAADELRRLGRAWFDRMRACGPEVRELFHDGGAVACVEDAPFASVGVFKAHVNLGFFHGAALADPAGLLHGDGKRMRHVTLRPGEPVDAEALNALIAAAYRHIKLRLETDA